MPEEHRTFMITSPPMQGGDVKRWQEILNAQFEEWGIDFQVPVDGEYSRAIKGASAMVLFGLGIKTVRMKPGVTHELRIKVRDKSLTPTEKDTRRARLPWRQFQRRKYADGGLSSPVSKILQDSWGYHKGVHGGVDLICPPNAPIFAICRAKIIDVREGGWWGNPTPTADHPASDGDGIIQLECLADNGPFRKGLHFGYGHSEHHTVSVGDIVEAGQRIGEAGFANAWHVHFMVNDGTTTAGIGDRDPKPFVDYARKYG